jgi:hypothetical protein
LFGNTLKAVSIQQGEMKLTQRLNAAEPQPNGNAFNAETLRTQRAAKLFL